MLALSMVALVVSPSLRARADALVFQGSASGHPTLDQGEGGGNPFASALIEILKRPTVRLAELPAALQQLTAKKSGGFQSADVPKTVASGEWQLVPAKGGERRVALVMVVSNYTRSGAQSLPGAKRDAERVAAALTGAGFRTEVALDLDLAAMRAKLSSFAAAAAAQDAAVVYTTGHGVEAGCHVYLLPGDYPIEQRNAALAQRALRLSEIAASVRARAINLVFYGGCRDNPFGP